MVKFVKKLFVDSDEPLIMKMDLALVLLDGLFLWKGFEMLGLEKQLTPIIGKLWTFCIEFLVFFMIWYFGRKINHYVGNKIIRRRKSKRG